MHYKQLSLGKERYANEGIEVKGHSKFRDAIERDKANKRKMTGKHLPIYVMPEMRKNGVVEGIAWLQKRAGVKTRLLSRFEFKLIRYFSFRPTTIFSFTTSPSSSTP